MNAQKPREVFPLNIDGNDQVLVTMDAKAMRELFTKQIYSNPEAGFRELYANAVRACKIAKEEYGSNPCIEIIIDPANLEFKMIEHDSTGITDKTFREVLTVLGRSSNYNGKLPGQFGIGLAAYYAISDNMFLKSYSMDGGKISYLIREMDVCDNLIKTNPVSLETYGTELKFKMQHIDKFGDDGESDYDWNALYRVTSYLEMIARFSGVNTKLTIVNEDENWEGKRGTTSIGLKDPKQLMSHSGNLRDDQLFKISNDDYDLTAYKGSTWTFRSVTLAGMPIDCNLQTLSLFDNYHINIKNERTYRPIASRDAFTDESKTALDDKIKQDMLKWLMQFSYIKTLDEWQDIPEQIMEYILNLIQTMDILKDMGGYVRTVDEEKLVNLFKITKLARDPCRMYIDGKEKSMRLHNIMKILKNNKIEKICCLERYSEMKIKELGEYAVIIPSTENFEELCRHVKNGKEIPATKKFVKMYSSKDPGVPIILEEKDILDTDIRVNSEASSQAGRFKYAEWKGKEYRFFNGNGKGTYIIDFCNSAMEQMHDGVSGAEIAESMKKIEETYMLVDVNEKVIDNLKQGDLKSRHVRISDDDLTTLQAACLIIQYTIKIPKRTFKHEIYKILSNNYGKHVDMAFNHAHLAIKSLDNIKGKKLREYIAEYYSNSCPYFDEAGALEIIKDIEDCIETVKDIKGAFAKILSIVVNSEKDLTMAWEHVFDRMHLDIEKVDAIVKEIGGINGMLKINEQNLKNVISYNVISQSPIIGDEKMDRMINIGLITKILKVTPVVKDGKLITNVEIE